MLQIDSGGLLPSIAILACSLKIALTFYLHGSIAPTTATSAAMQRRGRTTPLISGLNGTSSAQIGNSNKRVAIGKPMIIIFLVYIPQSIDGRAERQSLRNGTAKELCGVVRILQVIVLIDWTGSCSLIRLKPLVVDSLTPFLHEDELGTDDRGNAEEFAGTGTGNNHLEWSPSYNDDGQFQTAIPKLFTQAVTLQW